MTQCKKRLVGLTVLTSLTLGILAGPTVAATTGEIDQRWCYACSLNQEIEEVDERMEAAHEMAEAARALGLAESDEVIVRAKDIWTEAHNKLTEAETAQANIPCTGHGYQFDLFQPSGLSAQAFDKLLEGSPLAGHGCDVLEMERTYRVNGVFALAVAMTESGLGQSGLAKTKNNYFGMLGQSFASPREGILAFGELMCRDLYHGRSLSSIAKIYCPPTSKEWAGSVSSLMSGFWQRLS